MTTLFSGLPAAPGIGIGRLMVRPANKPAIIAEMSTLEAGAEWKAFLHAQAEVDAELAGLDQLANPLVAEIFSAHRMILQDKTLIEPVRSKIDAGRSAASATQQVIDELAALFHALEDEYFASRAQDILDIGKRLLHHLLPASPLPSLADLPKEIILIAHDLTLSELSELSTQSVLGIVLADSTPTAHSAILARSLGIPLACSFGDEVLQLTSGQMAIVDGNDGVLMVEPNADELRRYSDVHQYRMQEEELAAEHAHEPACTLDGVHIPVYVNANRPDDITQSLALGADGIGLLRTEYLFQARSVPPDRAEQEATYRRFAEQLGNRLLTIRALDAGGDKPVDFVLHANEQNPFLGLRGIRLLLTRPELLRTQFEAILGVARTLGTRANLRFMLPMISTAEELHSARRVINELFNLEEIAHIPAHTLVKIGVLVEVPAAALMARHLAPAIDFFSIGTNDLAQYVLASDRTNSSVANLADPLHPAVLQLVEKTCLAASDAGIPVSLCGEIAGDPHATPLLLGLGVTELSVPLPAAPLIKQAVRRCELIQCRQLAQQALLCPDAEMVRRLLVGFAGKA